MSIPQDDPLRCGLAWAAKVACSGKYLTGRTARDVLLESIAWTFSTADELQVLRGKRPTDPLLQGVDIAEDDANHSVTLTRV